MKITEIQSLDYGVGIYFIEDGVKSFFVKKFNDGFALATEADGYLRKIEDDPDLLSYVGAVQKGEHKSHPLSSD